MKFFELYIAMVTLCMTPHSSWLTDGPTDLGHSPDTFYFHIHPRSHVLVGVLKWATSGCFVPVCQLSEPTAKNCFWSPQHKKKKNKKSRDKHDTVKTRSCQTHSGQLKLCLTAALSLSFIACVFVPRSCYRQTNNALKGTWIVLIPEPLQSRWPCINVFTDIRVSLQRLSPHVCARQSRPVRACLKEAALNNSLPILYLRLKKRIPSPA